MDARDISKTSPSKQRRVNVDATSSCRIDVNTSLFERYVLTGKRDGTVTRNEVCVCRLQSIVLVFYDGIIPPLPNFSTKYLMMCKVYTNVGGIK